MQILSRNELEERIFIQIYPEQQENVYVSMQHLVMAALEYYVWYATFLINNIPEYDATYDSIVFNKAEEQHKKCSR